MQAVLKELDGIIDGMPDAAPEEKKKKKGGCEVNVEASLWQTDERRAFFVKR